MENKPITLQQERLFSTSYFPSIAIAAAMAKSGTIVIDTKETFPKQTHRNRTVILTANGPMTLSVPTIRTSGNHTITEEIEISYAERWNIIHWRAIVSAYNSSPYFMYYSDGIEKILTQRYRLLTELNNTLLSHLLSLMKIDLKITTTTEFIKPENSPWDYRDKFSYKHPDKSIFYPEYIQVFSDRIPFNGNVSILDLLFNMGPESKDYLLSLEV